MNPWTTALDRNLELWIDCLPTSAVVTDDDDELAGVALWQERHDLATLVALHVVPGRRRAGLGGRLLDAFVAAAYAGGARRVALGVHESNVGAERLYRAHGFHSVSTDGDYRLFERAL